MTDPQENQVLLEFAPPRELNLVCISPRLAPLAFTQLIPFLWPADSLIGICGTYPCGPSARLLLVEFSAAPLESQSTSVTTTDPTDVNPSSVAARVLQFLVVHSPPSKTGVIPVIHALRLLRHDHVRHGAEATTVPKSHCGNEVGNRATSWRHHHRPLDGCQRWSPSLCGTGATSPSISCEWACVVGGVWVVMNCNTVCNSTAVNCMSFGVIAAGNLEGTTFHNIAACRSCGSSSQKNEAVRT